MEVFVDEVLVLLVVVVEVLVLGGAVEDVVLDEDVEARVELVEVLVEVLVLEEEDMDMLVDVVESLVLELELVAVVDVAARDEADATM